MSKIKDVYTFNRQVRGRTFGAPAHSLENDLRLDRTNLMQEELNEFWEATTLEDQVDALIDLQYFLYGTLYEMGVSQDQYDECWRRVHEANMAKKAGVKPGRSSTADAKKPAEWVAPNFDGVFNVSSD